VRFGQRVVEPHGMTRVFDRALQQVFCRFVVRPRRLVEGELRAGETSVRQRVPGVGRDGAFEIDYRPWHLADVECFEPQRALGEGPVGFQARRVARARA